jgi:hypothetical protein
MTVAAGRPPSLRVGPSEYDALVTRLRSLVHSALPTQATVLVVSKGDERMLELEGHEAWHFPQDEQGRYPGYYPSDSAEAIAHLEELRSRGADYLILPATAFWWLDHYEELARHLESHYGLAARQDDTALIFSLGAAKAAVGHVVVHPRHQLVQQLRGFLDSLLPPHATVLVVSSGDSNLLDLGDRPAWHFPQTGTGAHASHLPSEGDAIGANLGQLHSKGAEFLVVPAITPSWLDYYPDFLRDVGERYRRVARQQHLCTVFDLGQPLEPEPEAEEGEDGSERRSLLGRLLSGRGRAKRAGARGREYRE